MREVETNYYPTTVFCRFEKPAFIENIARDDRDYLYVTNIDEGAVYKVDSNGKAEEYAKTNGRLTGIIAMEGGSFFCCGWDLDGRPTIFFLDVHRRLIPILRLADALFLNGMARISADRLLICDAYRGLIWQYDPNTNQAEPWLRNELLTRLDPDNPMPAANGIKAYNGTVFVSNTARNLLLTIPVAGRVPGEPTVFLEGINLDDFAIDGDGTIYATTHIFNSVVEIKPDRSISEIAAAEHGVAGSTAALIKADASGKRSLYVTTNGGLSLPPANGLEDGKIVKIDLP